MDDNIIMVSVFCMTYNQKRYIRDTLEGIIAQCVGFRYEVVVHDDASDDGTVEILWEYEKKYPDIIRVIYEMDNQYSKGMLDDVLHEIEMNLKGKYIALCEGDDCWIDRNKLQLQVDYMENHAECSLCMHNAVDVNCVTGSIKDVFPFGIGSRYLSPSEIISQKNGHPPTASFLVRRECLCTKDYAIHAPVGDYPLQLNALLFGKIYYMDRIMSVYRRYSSDKANSSLLLVDELLMKQVIGLIRYLTLYNMDTDGIFDDEIRQKVSFCIIHVLMNLKEKSIYDYVDEEHVDYENVEIFRRALFDVAYIPDGLHKLVESHKKIYIMGTGKAGNYFFEKCQKCRIAVEGFVVTKKDMDKCKGYDVYTFDELEITDEVGVVIAVFPITKEYNNNVLKELKERNIDYYWIFNN